MSDEIEFMADFGENKKLKQLAEIITGLIGIILNAVGMLEDRINQLDNEVKALERKISMLENKVSAPSPAVLAQPSPLPSPAMSTPSPHFEEDRFEREMKPAPAVMAKAPVAGRPASTSAPSSPASARMQLQSELKELFSRLRRAE